MKKLKFNLMIIAVIIGVGGAVATRAASHKARSGDTSYEWLNANMDPTDDFSTVTDEKNASGCKGSGTICEYGYLSSQFNTPGDQESGLVTGAEPQTQINHN